MTKLRVLPPAPESGTNPKRKKFAPHPWHFHSDSHVELAKAFLNQLEVNIDGKLHPPVYDEGNFYTYDDELGIWAKITESEAGRRVQEFDGTQIGRDALKLKEADVLGALSCARREANAPGFFASTPPGLVFRNAMVQVTKEGGVELKPHSSEHRARFAYNFDYTEEEPEEFLRRVGGMFRPDADAAEKIQLIGEFAGACLLGGATKLQRWVLLKGSGDDGKSTLIDLIRGAMPEGSTCSIKPECLEDEYDRADLAGKLLNTVTEVKQREVLNAETLKAVSAGDSMRGRPIRAAPIEFKPIAGHLFAANGYPKFSDSSHGFWRRPIVVTFNRRFTHDPERVVGLAEELLATQRPAIVSWFVRKGAGALARGFYTLPPSHEAAIRDWRGETDAVYEFIEERLVATTTMPPSQENGWRSPAELYGLFREWSEETGHKPMSSVGFARRLTELGYAEARCHGRRYRPLRPLKSSETKAPGGGVLQN